jgi:hypothetical protein
MKLRSYICVVLIFTFYTKTLIADAEISDSDNHHEAQAACTQGSNNQTKNACIAISPDEQKTIEETSKAIFSGAEKLFNESDYCNCFNITLGIVARIKGVLGWAPIDFPNEIAKHTRQKITDSELNPSGKRSYVYSAAYQQCGAKKILKLLQKPGVRKCWHRQV